MIMQTKIINITNIDYDCNNSMNDINKKQQKQHLITVTSTIMKIHPKSLKSGNYNSILAKEAGQF